MLIKTNINRLFDSPKKKNMRTDSYVGAALFRSNNFCRINYQKIHPDKNSVVKSGGKQ